jgi:hypothetical protein
MASISGISGSVPILKIFYLNLEQSIIVGYHLIHINTILGNQSVFNGRTTLLLLQKKQKHNFSTYYSFEIKFFFLESASLIGLLLYSIWSRLWLSLKALVV